MIVSHTLSIFGICMVMFNIPECRGFAYPLDHVSILSEEYMGFQQSPPARNEENDTSELEGIRTKRFLRSSICPLGWHEYASQFKYCYYISESTRTFAKAKGFCRYHAAQLASIHEAEEHEFLLSLMIQAKIKEVWIGLENPYGETLKWVDGSNVNYRSIAGEEYNDDNGKNKETCVRMVYNSNEDLENGWLDNTCSQSYHAICKKPKPSREACSWVEIRQKNFATGTKYKVMTVSSKKRCLYACQRRRVSKGQCRSIVWRNKKENNCRLSLETRQSLSLKHCKTCTFAEYGCWTCKPGWIEYSTSDKHCYQYSETARTYTEAIHDCALKAIGGRLMKVTNTKRLALMEDMMTRVGAVRTWLKWDKHIKLKKTYLTKNRYRCAILLSERDGRLAPGYNYISCYEKAEYMCIVNKKFNHYMT